MTTIKDYAFRECSNLDSVVIPNSVTTIEGGAFWDCECLTSVTIPSSVTKIGAYAFGDCENIMTVISLIEEPFAIEGGLADYPTFSEYTFSDATLYVPEGTSEKYKATDGWMDFENIVEGLPEGILSTSMPETSSALYDLSGRRLQQKPQKGIYIQDGKKVLVK